MTAFDSSVVKAQADAADAEIARLTVELNQALVAWESSDDRVDALERQIITLEARIAELEAGNLKPGLRGLIVTQPDNLDMVPYAEFGSVKLRWNSIEIAPGVYDFGLLDSVLNDHPDIKFRVRFMAGIHAPQWVKDRSGGAVQHYPSTPNGGSGMVPRYWTPAYLTDYMTLMRAVADRYETNPQVVEIPNSMTTTVYAEPFILGADAATIDRYWQAGYTKDAHEAGLRLSILGMMSLFPTTRISLAGHSKWQFIVQGTGGPGDGKAASSWEDERTLLNDLSATYGKRLVLEDHGLGPNDTAPFDESRETAKSWYAYMAGLRSSEQTYGWQFTLNGGSMETAADMGVAMGACFLEFAAFAAIPEPKRRQVHDALLANAGGKP
jgi:hypothetical protein